MGEFLNLVVFVAIIVGVIWVIAANQDGEVGRTLRKQNFKSTRILTTFDNKQGLALSMSGKNIAYISGGRAAILDKTTLLGVEVETDARAVTRREGMVGRAVVGEMILGPLGAILAAASAPGATDYELTRIALVLRFNSPRNPIFKLRTFSSRRFVSIRSEVAAPALDKVQTWVATLEAWRAN